MTTESNTLYETKTKHIRKTYQILITKLLVLKVTTKNIRTVLSLRGNTSPPGDRYPQFSMLGKQSIIT